MKIEEKCMGGIKKRRKIGGQERREGNGWH